MSDILDEMLGKDATNLTKEKLIMMLTDFDNRLSKLENKEATGGVYVDGSPKIVKDYYRDLLEEEAKQRGGK